jgi:phospholipid/cholesterol/gamma-HCH transport system ATP-binding protein
MSENEHCIEVQGLYKSFGEQEVLKGVDLSINKGDSVSIIGRSGSGKSVLIKHFIRLMEPDRGKVIVFGRDINQLKYKNVVRTRLRFGMLFQSAALFDSMTVAENVGLGLRESRKHSQEEIDEIVQEKLGLVGLQDAAEKYPAELSGGMRKRAGLARAIAHGPEVLLYDEPTTGLDPITADVIDDLIVDLNTKLSVTSVVVTHDMKSAFKISSRVIMLYQGKVQFDGTPDELQKTDDAVVRQFVEGSARGPILI